MRMKKVTRWGVL